MKTLRTPDNLPDYPFAPSYVARDVHPVPDTRW